MAQIQLIDALTGMFRLLGDETRLRILSLLQENELAVGELQKILNLGQSTLSTQLGLMKEQDLVASRKEGQKVYYRIPAEMKLDKFYGILEKALEGARTAKWFDRDRRNLRKILLERSESSLNFFNSLAHQNKPSPGQTWKSLSLGILKLIRNLRIVDLGCGNGRLAALLYAAGNQVTAVDNSAEQIRLAKRQHPDKGDIVFVQAPMEDTGLQAGSFDLVILSQSLHHAAKPQEVIRESYRLLEKGGRILILDLLAHGEEWMQKKWGDFWLGFSLADLESWLRDSRYLNIQNEIFGNSHSHPTIESIVVVAEK